MHCYTFHYSFIFSGKLPMSDFWSFSVLIPGNSLGNPLINCTLPWIAQVVSWSMTSSRDTLIEVLISM